MKTKQLLVLSLSVMGMLTSSISYSQSLIDMKFIGRYESGFFDEGGTEISTYDAATSRIFSVNGATGNIDIIDLSNPANPSYVNSINLSSFGGGANSVDIYNGILAAAVEANVKTDSGKVVFFDAYGNFINAVTVGALPDMIVYSRDGMKVLVACEGEPNDDYTIDPDGTIGVINLGNSPASLTQSDVTLINFSAYNNAPVQGVRVFGPGATFAQDMEPEYITIADNNKTAWVTLQENNAVARINLQSNSIVALYPLGTKNHNLAGNGFDGSDRNSGKINIASWPVKGMFQPDAIGSYAFQGQTFLVTANEGDVRDYDGYSEIARVKDLVLDPIVFADQAILKNDSSIGRLNVTTANGDIDGDGDFDELYAFGSRSFSIWTADGNLVYDSGDFMEQYTAGLYPDNFNASNSSNTRKNRSDDKGPEPEGLTVVKIIDSVFVFVGLERIGGVMAFNITDPLNPRFVNYINTRDFSQTPGNGYTADLGPEGLLFIPWNKSPNGKNLLVLSNEISGTLSIYETDVLCGNKKVQVCLNETTFCVNQTQLPGYLAAGAVLGPCLNEARLADQELTMATSITAFPNPAGEKVTIRMNNLVEGIYSLNVFDCNGKLVRFEKLEQAVAGDRLFEIDLNLINAGLYGYSLTGPDQVIISGRFSVIK